MTQIIPKSRSLGLSADVTNIELAMFYEAARKNPLKFVQDGKYLAWLKEQAKRKNFLKKRPDENRKQYRARIFKND